MGRLARERCERPVEAAMFSVHAGGQPPSARDGDEPCLPARDSAKLGLERSVARANFESDEA